MVNYINLLWLLYTISSTLAQLSSPSHERDEEEDDEDRREDHYDAHLPLHTRLLEHLVHLSLRRRQPAVRAVDVLLELVNHLPLRLELLADGQADLP